MNTRAAGALALALAVLPQLAHAAGKDANAIELNAFEILLTIAVGGFFGGLVDGLRAERQYRWRFGSFTKDWGTLGDALVGVTAALAIFAFAENLFGSGGITSPMPIYVFLKLVAWGVLSGYAGTKLLDTLTSKAIKALAEEAANKAVKEQVASNDETQQNINEAGQLVTQHVALITGLASGPPSDEAAQKLARDAERKLDDAQRKYDLVLKREPGNRRAQLGLANVHSYRGEFLQKIGSAQSADSFAKAISVVDDLIRREPTMAKAYYNRACYRALKAGPSAVPAEAVADLKRAVELDENLKQYAQGDSDLASLKGDPTLSFLFGKDGKGP